ncbi:RNA polymerase ECF family sigma subunit [Pseudorhodoplanes sinuspersici]|uniref:Uncharacterized protein n=2 Tax=Pseudorhodoplanes sinuspersici TaxID=1235591 RepID=A0A1W6ZLE6_9HYPH|nr:hypothetical protein CAK95_02445 [Pseudorhodoplanes sinuspersici]RKE68181.1 RNA polymerase ECF family sigma subunit [Pseudorhodoplanes sinuspersici]
MHPDENELRRLLIDGLQGNSDAYRLYLAKLTSLLRPYVNRHLLRVRGSSDDFEDIVQEALISIHAKRHTYEPDLPVTAWAYAITRYKLIDYLRASNRRIPTEPLQETDGLIDNGEQIEAVLDVRKGIAALPPSLRKPLQSVKLDGFNAQDVAEQSGSSPVTVRVNIHRALKALSGWLGHAKDKTDANK